MGRIPGVVLDVELSAPLPSVAAVDALGNRADAAWVIVRLFTEPLAMVTIDLPDDGLTPADLLAATATAAGADAIGRRLTEVGLAPDALTVHGVVPAHVPPFIADRNHALAAEQPVTVVICTREHPDELRACLASLVDQEYDRFDVLVVDNAPTSDRTRHVVDEFVGRLAIRYTVEPRPGLSRARNHAIAALSHEPADRVVAWTDDDVRVDRHWVGEVARTFVENPAAAAMSGAVVPAELRTQAQVWFEQFGGHSKGRGFTPDAFGPVNSFQPPRMPWVKRPRQESVEKNSWTEQSPLYPLPAYGVGANMAFRLAALRRLGGFDEALGAGTPAQGGEDTLVFSRLLHGGAVTLYRPSALVRHVHRPDLDGLRRQMAGYGSGLTAYYAALIRHDPRVVLELVRLVPRALRDLTSKDSVRVSTVREDFPPGLFAANRRGLLVGVWRYLRGRRALRGRAVTAAPKTAVGLR
ncbi:glycosyltransferase [Cryptosporangium aurantiacum]|uniref:Glycosyltransferase, GT2 family n=1 Tax=Cryptosporangium aurantiacum TaxID=134849 RepID=A0A1M7RNB7_9ACTN|nr:glycosyltransferase family 2 protein [Cryptosporangium aurantiacum]SHN47572.1 Glycosyltransferase, GT2 family [Cryptosporangium aurantiacum]